MEKVNTRINADHSIIATHLLHDELFDRNPIGVVIYDLQGRIQFLDANFALMHGYLYHEIFGKMMSAFHTTEQMRQEVLPSLQKATVHGACKSRVGCLRKDGSVFSARMSIQVLNNGNGVAAAFLVVLRNDTDGFKQDTHHSIPDETKGKEPNFRHFIHDFNNLMNIIRGNIELTIKIIPNKGPVWSNLEEVLIATTRAQEIIQGIATPRRPCCAAQGSRPLQIPLLVKDTLKLLRNSIPTNIEVIENSYCQNGLVFADPLQIQRVVLNLCINGCEAMGQRGGRLTVTVKDVAVVTEGCISPPLKPGKYICLSVGDTGKGIFHDALNRIFEPHYTTKENGSGLGLCIVREILENYGGDIRVSTQPGSGTIFEVYFPEIESDVPNLKGMSEVFGN
jgi:PAS domain S-box-containing protein